jgi:chromate transporter
MKGLGAVLLVLAGQFSALSLMAFGGGINTVVPELHRQAVPIHHWMDDRTFADLFAIAQASPGPNMLIVTLVGLKAAGLAGALVATIAVCAPTCLLTFGVMRVWDKVRETRWRAVVQQGIGPVSVGLISATALVLSRAADHAGGLVAITLATAAFTFFTRFNPLWALAAAAGLGLIGVVR